MKTNTPTVTALLAFLAHNKQPSETKQTAAAKENPKFIWITKISRETWYWIVLAVFHISSEEKSSSSSLTMINTTRTSLRFLLEYFYVFEKIWIIIKTFWRCSGSCVAFVSWDQRKCLSIRARSRARERRRIKKCKFYVNIMTNSEFFIGFRVWEKNLWVMKLDE